MDDAWRGVSTRAAEHDNQPPFDLPKRWLERKDRLDLDTPLNFVSTADIIGGNSGSPVVNRNGELVGIIFDGNLPVAGVGTYVYTDDAGRALAVHSAARSSKPCARSTTPASWPTN